MEKDNILKYLKDWNFWGSDLDIGIKRNAYFSKIINSIKTKEIIVLAGVRRCGKSTLLLQLLNEIISKSKAKNTLIVNLEDPRVVNLTVNELMEIYEVYIEFLKPEKEHFVVLDEIQNVNNWEKFARYLYENKKVNVFITGSNSRLLSSEFSSTLSGRHINYIINPLSFTEFLEFKNLMINDKLAIIKNENTIKQFFEEYLKWGGFPKIVLTDNENERKKILNSYYDTILIKDIALRYKIKETSKLQELSRFYLTNISKIVSMNKIKDAIGVSLETVQRFSEYLGSSYLISFLLKFDYSYKKQILNPKKVYAVDLGLRNNASFQFSDDYGRLLENVVYLELKRRGKDIYYYKTTNDLEIDFVVKENKKIKSMIQVTNNLDDFSVKERELKALVKGLKENNLKQGLVFTRDTEDVIKIKEFNIIVKPIWKWLLENVIK